MKIKLSLVSSLVFLLSTAILGTIYLAWLFYPLEIKWLNLEAVVPLSQADIYQQFTILLRYLTIPWIQELSMPAFPSSANGLHHFQQVKWLFHLTQAIFLITLPGFIVFWKNEVKKGYGTSSFPIFKVACWLPLAIALFGLVIGFDHFFILFHQILFPGDDTWLFHPDTDPVILILPESFFLHCFLLFLVLYESLYWMVLVNCRPPKQNQNKKRFLWKKYM